MGTTEHVRAGQPYTVTFWPNNETCRDYAVLDCDGEIEASFGFEDTASAHADRLNSK
jgi:hypothetical protein